jgi:D-inositol-3-phosphate glycosyltransferase
MEEQRRRTRLVRTVTRLVSHLRRALHAARRAGPGRYPGSITSVAFGPTGDVDIGGFALVPGEEIQAVVVSVNDTIVGVAAVGVATPEVASARPEEPGAHRAGWRLAVPRDAVPAGPVTIRAVAMTRTGLAEPLEPATWTLPAAGSEAPGRPASVTGHLDEPHARSSTLGATVDVTGWVAPARLVDRVEVFVDDAPAGPARLFCTPRPDIAVHLGDDTAGLAGFWHLAEVAAPPGATVRVRVQVVTPTGRVALGHRNVVVPAVPPAPDDEDRAWVAALRARAAMTAETWVPGDGVNLFVVAHDLGLGGAQLWLQEILRRFLTEPDASCTVVAPADGPLRRELEAAGARVHIVGRFPSQSGAYESAARELTQLATDAGANVVLVNSMGSFIGVDCAARMGIPSLLAIHEHYPLRTFLRFAFGDEPVDAYVQSRARGALDDARLVCFVADATRELYARIGADRLERFVRIDHGIERDRFTPGATATRDELRRSHGFAPEDHLLLGIGSVEGRKGQGSLVLAFDRLAATDPGAQLVLVGNAATPYGGALAGLVDALGLARRVRMVGPTSDVTPWYAMADDFVLASDAESLPSVLLEAMVAEVPVLATDVGGVAELVRDGDTGILCAPRDVGALAHGLRRLLRMSADDRKAMVTRAAARMGTHRDVEAYTGSFARLLRALAKDPGISLEAALDG